MKKIKLLSALAIALMIAACGGTNPKEGDQSFEDLGNDAEFKEKHDEPRRGEEMADLNGETIEIAVEGQMDAKAYAVLNENSNTYLLVFHEWWGLNEYVKTEADRLHNELDEINIIALDLYDGKVAKVRDSAQKYMQSADAARINSIIEGTLKMLPANAKLGTIGWCFGGGWSLKGAIAAGERAEACVMYYGMPVDDVEQLSELSTDVLFLYGKQDKWINEQVANQFVENMKQVDQELMVNGFDADHAFANPTQESYNQKAAQEANAIALQFLRDRLLGSEEMAMKE